MLNNFQYWQRYIGTDPCRLLKIRIDMVALPCFLKVKKPIPKPLSAFYPKKLETIGDHLRKTRLDRNLLQRELATKLSVCPTTIKNWEKGHKEPTDSLLPRICDFLGYCPLVEKAPEHFGHKVSRYRKYLLGFSLEKLAEQIGVDPATLSEIEQRNVIRFKTVENAMAKFTLQLGWTQVTDNRFQITRLPRSKWKVIQ